MTHHLRDAWPTDAGQTGDILWHSRERTAPATELFSSAEAIALCGGMIDRGWVTVAHCEDGQILGFLARDGGHIHALYVAREAAGKGVGKALLDHAKTQAGRLTLSTSPSNKAALKFYRREAFVETAGAGGDPAAEIVLEWQGEVGK